jgi:hypothetical protein
VGTSTAAFIGPATGGDVNVPTMVTSLDQFLATYGSQPLPGFFLWYAVQGFYQNNGQTCYIVRASNGAPGSLTIQDREGTPRDLITVRARQLGDPGTPIDVQTTAAHLLTTGNTSLYQPEGTLSSITGRNVTLNAGQGAQFRPGDWITLGTGGERVQIVSTGGDTLRLGADLTGVYAPGTVVRLADAPSGTQTIRTRSTVAIPAGGLVPGTILTIAQGGLHDSQIVQSVQMEALTPTLTTYRVTFRLGLAIPLSLDPANPATVQSEEFNLQVTQGASSTTYGNLSIDSAHPNYYVNTINNGNGLIVVQPVEPPPPVKPPLNLPENMGSSQALSGGTNEDLTTLTDAQYTSALNTLRQLHDVNLVAIPDCTTLPAAQAATVQQAMITQCEQLGDRFAVLDAQPGLPLYGSNSIETQRQGLDSTRGYAALYYPWLRVPPVGAGDPVLVPPSGHVCGIMARSDATRGVHKAPANEIVAGALGVERTMSNIDQGQLNLLGIDVIRLFTTGGHPILWAARTTATDTNWQYVNIRRLFIYLEQSIEQGIRWAVFEPNNLQLWQQLKRSIADFLTRVWRDGALFGATADQAFYVRIDDVLNPFSEQALGRLHIEIGVRPSYPAEFIIVRIGIWQGGAQISEG